MLNHDPDRLFNLAVDAFGDYIKATLHNRERTVTSVDIDWTRWFSRNVHEALGSVMLLSHDANDVTKRLLRELDIFLKMKYEAMEYHFTDPCAISLLTNALVHPAVTHLNFLETETYYRFSQVDRMLSQDVSEMNNIKVLQLGRMPSNIQKLTFPNLQEFTLICNDGLLKKLLVTCGNIRKLDISHSKHVTDAAVEFLVKFKHLEELNIKRTLIGPDGLTQLLTDLSKNKDSEGVPLLKSLGLYFLYPQQLQLLVDNFQNLVKLELGQISDHCNYSLLRNLKNLQSFTIHSVCVLERILEMIRHQLKQLEFYNVFIEDDACSIFKYCPSLVRLNLVTINCSHVFEMTPHCNLKSLKVVELKVYEPSNFVDFILSNCTNVRVLKIKCSDVDSNELATAMLQNNPLEHLEELHWWSDDGGQPLLPEVGRQIVRQCKNLKVMYGNIWWSRRRSQKPWFSNNGVHVRVSNHSSIPYHGFEVHPELI